jgi:glycosyltransferase involved in cell wall biosynthesis
VSSRAEGITILMPVKHYNAGFLQRALESVTRQRDADWYLLVIGEAGGIETLSEALGPAAEDQRCELIVNEGRKLAGALNTGMRHARTDFVALLLADDMWAPDAVAVLKDYLRRCPRADFFHSSRVVIDEHDAPISSICPSQEVVTLQDFEWSSPVKHLLCWRRAKALSFGGMDESLDSVGPDDFDFPWTMAERGAGFVAVRECLYLYRDHREGYRLTTHLPLSTHTREIRKIMKKHGASGSAIAARLADAKQSYLRQCLYASAWDQWVKEKLGYDARRGWREKYR